MDIDKLAQVISKAKVLGPAAVIVVRSAAEDEEDYTIALAQLAKATSALVVSIPEGMTIATMDEAQMAENGWIRKSPLVERVEHLAEARGADAFAPVPDEPPPAPRSLGPTIKCRSCPARVVMCVTTNNKPIPMDPHPVDNGNMVREPDHVTEDGTTMVRTLTKDELADEVFCSQVPRYVTHFATCPNASKHRR